MDTRSENDPRPKAQPARRAQQRPSSGFGGASRHHGADTSPNTTWTPANITTTVRAALIPVWVLLCALAKPQMGVAFSGFSLLVALFYIALAATDKLDGYLARSRNEITVFGKFLDPIADKMIVLTAMCYLLEQGLVPLWMVVVVLAREFMVSGLRMIVANAGVVVAASDLGKIKTATTLTGISCLLVALACPAGFFLDLLLLVGKICMWAAVLLTAWSGLDYLWKCKDYIFEEGRSA